MRCLSQHKLNGGDSRPDAGLRAERVLDIACLYDNAIAILMRDPGRRLPSHYPAGEGCVHSRGLSLCVTRCEL